MSTCREKPSFSTQLDFEQHIQSEHHGLYTDQQRLAIARTSGHKQTFLFDECPLCYDYKPFEKLADAEIPADLQRHISSHLVLLSLLCLPLRKDSELDDGPESARSTARNVSRSLSDAQGSVISWDSNGLADNKQFTREQAEVDAKISASDEEYGSDCGDWSLYENPETGGSLPYPARGSALDPDDFSKLQGFITRICSLPFPSRVHRNQPRTMKEATRNTEEPHPVDTRGLYLLSLDGCGVRGLSTLYVLKHIMDNLNHEREDASLPKVKPCEVFDLIGGTSTGGYVRRCPAVTPSNKSRLIAIMLGRLEMDVDECISKYCNLMKTIFAKKSNRIRFDWKLGINPRFDSQKLKAAFLEVIRSCDLPEDELFNDEKQRGCKV